MQTACSAAASGTCEVAQLQQPPLTYQACALDGGAQLANGALVNLGRAQFTFTNASCSYPSEAPLWDPPIVVVRTPSLPVPLAYGMADTEHKKIQLDDAYFEHCMLQAAWLQTLTDVIRWLSPACAAIASQQTCTQVGGVWTPPACDVQSQIYCREAGGVWDPAPMWTLKGGVDLLIVGLLQGVCSICTPLLLHPDTSAAHAHAHPSDPLLRSSMCACRRSCMSV